jgi:serralysin
MAIPNGVNALLSSDARRWDSGGRLGYGFGRGALITYSFMTQVPAYYNLNGATINFPTDKTATNFQVFSPQQQQAARNARREYEKVANILFQEVADDGNGGTIRFGNATPTSPSTWNPAGWAWRPSNQAIGGDVWINNNPTNPYTTELANPARGNFGFLTFIHELGHAVGGFNDVSLKTPGYGGVTLSASEDSYKYTIMSYNYHPDMPGIFPRTLMLYDIHALQSLYGTNWNYNSGNNTYSWSTNAVFLETIWDGGGIDTISALNQTQDAVINLNAGEFSSIGGTYLWGGRSYKAKNNLAIAYKAIIENATGGSGNDTLIGNNVSNLLNGNNGHDRLYGKDGNDTLYGGAGDDLLFDGDLDYLGLDRLYGGFGNDILSGAGKDTLSGGFNDDDYWLATSDVVIIEYPNEGIDSVQTSFSYTLGDNLENLVLTNGNTIGKGNILNNRISGSSGNDTLDGYIGSDTLIGGSGDDRLVDLSGRNFLYGGAGHDYLSVFNEDDVLRDADSQLYGESGNDSLFGSISNNYLSGGDGNDLLQDSEGNDTLYGGQGNDAISSWTGNDILYGEAGDDWLDGAFDNDILYGGEGNDTLGNSYYPESGNDQMFGEGGNDLIYGGAGTDTLVGGAGNDYLVGFGYDSSAEYDILTGGIGADTFVLGNNKGGNYFGTGYGLIADFNWSQGDRILINEGIASPIFGLPSAYSLVYGNWLGSTTQDTAILYNNNTDQICLVQDVTLSRSQFGGIVLTPLPVNTITIS